MPLFYFYIFSPFQKTHEPNTRTIIPFYRNPHFCQTQSQIPRSKLTGHQTCNAAELRGIRPSRQSPNGCASTSARLVARGNKHSFS